MAKNKGDAGQGAEANVWQLSLWDMDVLWPGVRPHKDWEGNEWPLGSTEHSVAGAPLANGFMALPWKLKGDLEYLPMCLDWNIGHMETDRVWHVRWTETDIHVQTTGQLGPCTCSGPLQNGCKVIGLGIPCGSGEA